MIIKVFKFNNNDKIEFTQKELENLLNEVYNNGYLDGRNSKDYTWTSPSWYLNGTQRYADDKTIITTCKDNNTTLSGQMSFDDINSNINTTTTTATNIGHGLDTKKLSCDALNDM